MADGFNTDDMLDSYLFENHQLLEKLQAIVLEKKDDGCFDEETIHEMFRTMHTIKGSSGFMMYDGMMVVAHKLEDVFDVLRKSHPENAPHMKLVELVLEVVDFLSGELRKIESGEPADGDSSELMAKLESFLIEVKAFIDTEEKREAKKTLDFQQFYIAPASSESSTYYEPALFIDLESSVEEIEARAERTREHIMEEAKSMYLAPGDFVIQSKPVADGAHRSETTNYIKVHVDKMDKLVDLVGELAAAQSENEMRNISTELQKVVMSMRMVPLTKTFQKMNRILFDVSRKLGKDVELIMEGEITEVDRNIAEHISNPLMHLVRNAADHGIELPEDRQKAGKTTRGHIILSAKIESDMVWITVEDDGRGLDREKIINKARSQGLLDEKIPDSAYTDKEVYQFITLPGFSTKESVTEYSGRGVGMDAVVSDITAIGGSLEIESQKGVGSKMILKFPLTLTVVNGAVIRLS